MAHGTAQLLFQELIGQKLNPGDNKTFTGVTVINVHNDIWKHRKILKGLLTQKLIAYALFNWTLLYLNNIILKNILKKHSTLTKIALNKILAFHDCPENQMRFFVILSTEVN